MNCYRHQDSTAVGSCKACMKGLCDECAVDMENGLACKDVCESEVLALNQMLQRSKKLYRIGEYKSKMPATGVLIWGLLTAGFWAVCAVSYFYGGKLDVGNLTTATLFTIIFGVVYWASRRTGLNC